MGGKTLTQRGPTNRGQGTATILVFVVGVVLMLTVPGAALLELITASTILPALIYGATVILYLAVRKRLEHQEGAFSLGRYELPVAIGALAWSAC